MKNLQKIFNNSPYEVTSEAEMVALGRSMAAELEPGQVFGLVGDLGAGNPAASPTFSLVHEHDDGTLPVAHFDFYRMKSPQEAIGIGWDEYLESGRILLVEWADRFDGELMPADTLWLVLRHTGENTRTVTLVG